MAREKPPLSREEFEDVKRVLFGRANSTLASFCNRLADHFWALDNYAASQNWEGREDRLIVFGIPPARRLRSNAKNYFSIYGVENPTETVLRCEFVFPKTPEREAIIHRHDPLHRLRISSINETEGEFAPLDYDYVVKIATAAREFRLRPT